MDSLIEIDNNGDFKVEGLKRVFYFFIWKSWNVLCRMKIKHLGQFKIRIRLKKGFH